MNRRTCAQWAAGFAGIRAPLRTSTRNPCDGLSKDVAINPGDVSRYSALLAIEQCPVKRCRFGPAEADPEVLAIDMKLPMQVQRPRVENPGCA